MANRNRHPSPALVLSLIALFVALGGTGYAAVTINGKNIKNNSIPGKKVKTNTLHGKKVKTNTLHGKKLKNGKVHGKKLKNGTVTGAKIDESTLSEVPSAANATNAAQLGGLAPEAYQSRVRWALVNSAGNGNQGTILAQSGGVSVAAGIAGFSYLDWGENIGSKALMVSLAQINKGFITVTPCGNNVVPADTSCAPAGTNNANHTIVRMRDSADSAAANQIYFIAVIG